MLRVASVLLGACTGLASCAVYSPWPLPTRNDLAHSVSPGGVRPLGMNAVATLAVINNPGLRAARAKLHVAQAQAFAAGLLPDPQLSFSRDYVMDHVVSRTDPRFPEFNAWGLGLSIDLQALLTHASRKAVGEASLDQARLDLLWQEWQTVAEARTLYVQQSIAAERTAFLRRAEQVYARAYARSRSALASGNVTLEQAGVEQSLLVNVRAQLGAAERGLIQAQQGLRTLLGVAPQVRLPLKPLARPTLLDRTAVTNAARRLASTRPDLLALRQGYRAQELRVRVAILSQFPNFNLGVTRARDVSDVHTTGFGVSMTLPVFSRGRGPIAIQRATRGQLRAEFQVRLDQAEGQIWQLWNEIVELDGERCALEAQRSGLKATLASAEQAYEQGNLPAASYLALVDSYLSAEATRADVLQNMWTDSIALATVLGTQVEPAVPAARPGKRG